MVQNVPTNQTANSQGKGGVLSSIASTAAIALPGVAIGSAVGGIMSLIPPNQKAITKQITDVFVAESKKEIKNKGLIKLLNRPEIIEAKKKFGTDAMGAIEELIKKLPKDDEFITLAKKAAKRTKTISLIKNGALFGMAAVLALNLIQSRKKSE